MLFETIAFFVIFKGTGWFLDRVVVREREDAKRAFEFKCGRLVFSFAIYMLFEKILFFLFISFSKLLKPMIFDFLTVCQLLSSLLTIFSRRNT